MYINDHVFAIILQVETFHYAHPKLCPNTSAKGNCDNEIILVVSPNTENDEKYVNYTAKIVHEICLK